MWMIGSFVWTKFLAEQEYRRYPVAHWKTHARFKRGAGERGCNLLLRDPRDPLRNVFLGNNYSLGDGRCVGTTLPLTDNTPGDSPLTREEWFLVLNSMFWVFDAKHVNPGVFDHLIAAFPTGALCRVRLDTAALSDELINARVRLSAINGGASNGARPRGTSTYRRLSEWSRPWPPMEIGLLDGIPPEVCADLLAIGGLTVSDA